MRTLKMIFDLGNNKTTTVSLADPKDDLTRAAVETVGASMVTKQAVIVGGSAITALSDCYIWETNKEELL